MAIPNEGTSRLSTAAQSGSPMLELDEIQHFPLARPRALAPRYGFRTFRRPDQSRAWHSGIIERVGHGGAVESSCPIDVRWVTVAFTATGSARSVSTIRTWQRFLKNPVRVADGPTLRWARISRRWPSATVTRTR